MPEVGYTRFLSLWRLYSGDLARLSADYYRLRNRIRRTKRITTTIYDSFLKEFSELERRRIELYNEIRNYWYVSPVRGRVNLFDELKDLIADVEKEREKLIELLEVVVPPAVWQPFICVYTWIATREAKTRFGKVERIIEVHLESQYRPDLVSRETIMEIVEDVIERFCRRINYDFIFEQPNILEGSEIFSEIPRDFHERARFSWQFLRPRREEKRGGVEMRIEVYDHTYDRMVAHGRTKLILRWWTMPVSAIVNSLIRGSMVTLRARGRKRQTTLVR